MSIPFSKKRPRKIRDCICLFVIFAAIALNHSQAQPAWWAERTATDTQPAQDYSAANLGQLKRFTQKGAEELNYRIPGGAGAELDSLVQTWLNNHPDPKDYEIVNVGQLKWIAAKFDTRLRAVLYRSTSPDWLAANSATDHEAINLGQLKTAFDFDLTVPGIDTDGDGLTDAEEHTLGSNANASDTDSDGFDDATEVANGTSPVSADTDGDSRDDGDDADPRESLVDWGKAPGASYALIELEVASGGGFVQDLNDKGEVLFDSRIWAGGEWTSRIAPEMTGVFPGSSSPDFPDGISFEILSSGWDFFNNSGTLIQNASLHPTDGAGVDSSTNCPVFWAAGQSVPSSIIATADLWDQPLWAAWPLGISNSGDMAVRATPQQIGSGSAAATERIMRFNSSGELMASLDGSDGFHPDGQYGHGSMSSSGWVASNLARSATQSQPAAYKVALWNPSSNPIPLPPEAEGWGYPVSVADLPNQKTALIAGQWNGSVHTGRVFLPDSANNYQYASSLSAQKIELLAGDGTGMTSDGKLWRNGSVIPLRHLSEKWKELEDDGYSLFPIKGNLNGIYLVDAQKEDESVAALLVPTHFVRRNVETGETDPDLHHLVPSDPRPEVELYVSSAEIDSNGDLLVTVNGVVTDHLSEVVSSGRISTLNFYANGAQKDSISLSYGAGSAPWTLADSRNPFVRTINVGKPKPGGYEIRAETDENPAGNKGWGRVAVGHYLASTAGPSNGAFNQLSIVSQGPFSTTAADSLTAYLADRAPQAGDPVFTEDGPDSCRFTGTLPIGGQQVPCTLELGEVNDPQNGARDSMIAVLRYTLPGGVSGTVVIGLRETGNASLRFIPDGSQTNGEETVQLTEEDLPGSQNHEIEPFLVKTKVPESWVGTQGFKILVNGEEHTLRKFNYGDGDYLYVTSLADTSRPKIFVPCQKPLPDEVALPDSEAPGDDVRFEMEFAGDTHELASLLVLPGAPFPNDEGDVVARAAAGFSADSPPALQRDGQQGWQEPGDTITWNDLYTAYRFIYPDAMSEALLRVYLQQGHQISLENVWGDFDFSYYGRVGTKALIKIEKNDDDIHPGITAQYLWMGLCKALVSPSFRQALAEDLNDDTLEIEALNLYKQQVGPAASEYGIAAAEMYLSGIGIALEPLDWVLIVNDVAEGHYTALAGLLPLVPRGLGKAIRIETKTGEVLGRIEQEALPELQQAARTRDLIAQGTVLDKYQLSAFFGKILSTPEGGIARIPKYEEGLKRAMKRRVPKPGELFEAHHDLPWSMRAWFGEHGL